MSDAARGHWCGGDQGRCQDPKGVRIDIFVLAEEAHVSAAAAAAALSLSLSLSLSFWVAGLLERTAALELVLDLEPNSAQKALT